MKHSPRFSNLPIWPKRAVPLLGVVLVLLIGLIDWLTGIEINLSIFYLLPITVVAWNDRKHGWGIATFSALTWLVAELLWQEHYSERWIPYWNCLVRFGTFIIASELTAQVAWRKRAEQELLKTQNAALQAEIVERTEADKRLKLLNERLEKLVEERTAAAEGRAQELARSGEILRKQTDILEGILNSMGDGVIVTDGQDQTILSNAEARRLLKTKLPAKAEEIFRLDSMSEPAPPKVELHSEAMEGVEVYLPDIHPPEGTWFRVTRRPLQSKGQEAAGQVYVFSDITHSKRLERQIAEISEREQNRIGQEIHDGLCQQLVSAAFACSNLQEQLKNAPPHAGARIAEISEILNNAITEARNVARGLYPVHLENNGLATALELMCESIQGVDCEADCDDQISIDNTVVAANLFRIAQESVNNALKHSGGRKISVGLNRLDNKLLLSIADDGKGLLQYANGEGMGLHIMKYRARMMGAELKVAPNSPRGTLVTCSLPAFNLRAL